MITYTRLRPYVYQLDFPLPHSVDAIKTELATLDWKPWVVGSGQNTIPTRSSNDGRSSTMLSEIASYFNDPNGYTSDVLDHLFSEDQFSPIWALTKDEMKNCVAPTVSYYKDAPNFETTIHLDNRRLVTSGMLTFTDNDDISISTWFYNTEEGSDPIRAINGNGKAWTAATMHNTWHKGGNYSSEDRYSLYFGLVLRIAH